MLTASRLPRSFFARPTPIVARDLLGKRLVRILNPHSCTGSDLSADDPSGTCHPLGPGTQRLSGCIVEVEAYAGAGDAASHASRGCTPRNASMFGAPGHAYVYLIYGLHHCFNVVTEPEGRPAAVLIRALEPLEGIEEMRTRRGGRPDTQLTSGPARLCQALEIDRRFDGTDLCAPDAPLFLENATGIPVEAIIAAPRIGVRGDETAMTIPWRFYVRDNQHVSR